jgi:cysteinyl-tRNA synthetase
MGLRLHNTLTRTKEDFVPIDPSNVRIYVCGPTVYDLAHIGNARPLIVFDVLFRLLRHIYGPDRVTYVRNITDVDDKINARAAEEGISIRELTERTTEQFHADAAALGCLTAEQVNKPGEPPRFVEPRATDHIAEMRAMIEALVAKGCAYVAEDHVLFHVAAMKDYGRLSNRTLDEMIAGARVEVAPYKRDPMDFVLWKPSKPGEPAWDSPAGIAAPGRPGWHLECSAMSDKWLWQEALPMLSAAALARPHQFDIHGGGIDLVFPHHENEIAQSRCAFATDGMANYWLHNGFLQVEGEKMSKSLGNFVTVRDVLNDWPGEVVRLNMLRTHYRQPMDWTVAGLREAERMLANWYELVGDIAPGLLCADAIDALADDLNTPEAFAALHELRGEAAKGARGAKASLKASAAMLGLMQLAPAEWTAARRAPASTDEAVIVDFITTRAAARKAKDFAEADRIRSEPEAMGIALKDAKDPKTGELVTTWEVKR